MPADEGSKMLEQLWRCFVALTLFAVSQPSISASLNTDAVTPRLERIECTALKFSETELGKGVECGWLTVPKSRIFPSRDIRLAVVIARASSKNTEQQPMLYLHGGPGIATLDAVPTALGGKSWPLFRVRHDLVFFDQRGTGRSVPSLCPGFNRAMGEVAATGLSGSAKTRAQVIAAKKCRSELRALNVNPASYSSSEIAADVEALRNVLGVGQWNIFATSFGSLPAAEVMRRWPTTVRALILDSAFPQNSSNRVGLIDATAASFAAFQRRCDSIPSCREQTNLRKSAGIIIRRLVALPLLAKPARLPGKHFATRYGR
jgi:pimeloyl-ACP methyl ester carboxylesterase